MKRNAVILVLIGMILLSLSVGRYAIPFFQGIPMSDMDVSVFFRIRLPRTILVALCGGMLSISGMTYQTIFQNPLVAPDVLGVAEGCSVGAAAAFLYGGTFFMKAQWTTFLAGLFTVYLVVKLSERIRGGKILSLIIAGIVAGSLASSMLMVMKYTADPSRQLPAMEYWLMGGFHNAKWEDIGAVLLLGIPSIVILYFLRWQIKLLTLGEDEAAALGVSVRLVRNMGILCATVLAAAVVSVAGVVSWIGLLAPHVVRVFHGNDMIDSFGISFSMGGILLLLSDILSRTLTASELPISILTSFFGAAFLLFLLRPRIY